MKELLQELIAIIESEQPTDAEWEHPPKTYDPYLSCGGGDCSKHGRFYGMCHCCYLEERAFYRRIREEFEWDKERKLRDLASRAKCAIS